MSSQLKNIRRDLRQYINPEKAAFLPRFFKTGPGEYGEGDKFLGIVVPDTRKVAQKYTDITLEDIDVLLHSQWHEERLLALLILVKKFSKSSDKEQREIYNYYLKNTAWINNWDLVDLSAEYIVGHYIFHHQDQLPTLTKLAGSSRLWDRRIAIISTYYFIIRGDPAPTLNIVSKLLTDPHDLIQKANGWMLRETAKRIDDQLIEKYIIDNYSKIPRTTLRYAIERFPEKRRKALLKGIII